MSKEEMYKKFRYELEDYAVPLIVKNLCYIELKDNKKIIGFACLEGDYLDAFYILPKYRLQGLGSKKAKELYELYKFKRLHIINNNLPALRFWNKIFQLKNIETNFCDTLYEIEKRNDSV